MRKVITMMSLFIGFGLAACSAPRPGGLGITNGKLAPCPASPNCVSSQAIDAEHRVEPMPYTIARTEALATAKAVIVATPRTKLVSTSDDYLHAEYTSLIFRFVDDLELWFDDAAKLIHVRSASRVGRSDLGVNRKRVEHLRELLMHRVHGTRDR
jgi:uncharacterized protein (DUF1499 family)